MYAVVRTDKMFGTDNRAGVVSVRYQPSGTMTQIDNGNVVKIGDLETGSREIYKGATPAANSDIKDIVLIASPEVLYEDYKRSLSDFTNKAGNIARGYYLHTNDIFSVTKDALDGKSTPAVHDVVELKAGTKLNVAASATSGSTVVGRIVDINVVGGYTFYAIQVG